MLLAVGAQVQLSPQAQFGPVKIEDDRPDEHFLYLSDVVSTAWQGIRYADTPPGGTLAVGLKVPLGGNYQLNK